MKKDITKAFGIKVAELRKKQGLSQEELAYRCGVHRTYIGFIERGEKSPTLKTVEKILNGLNISLSELWEAMQTD